MPDSTLNVGTATAANPIPSPIPQPALQPQQSLADRVTQLEQQVTHLLEQNSIACNRHDNSENRLASIEHHVGL